MAIDGTADSFLPLWNDCHAWFSEQFVSHGVPKLNHASDVEMFAIAGQEGGWKYRWQVLSGGGKGPAHGLWQFEKGGGVTGVLNNSRTSGYASAVCITLKIAANPTTVWNKMMEEGDGDKLAFAFARLLLWSDPSALPDPADDDATWACYQRNWRPGAPHRAAWTHNISEARRVLK